MSLLLFMSLINVSNDDFNLLIQQVLIAPGSEWGIVNVFSYFNSFFPWSLIN